MTDEGRLLAEVSLTVSQDPLASVMNELISDRIWGASRKGIICGSNNTRCSLVRTSYRLRRCFT